MTEEQSDQEAEKQEEEPKVGKKDFLQLIANALKIGTITSAQAKEMRQELNVFQSDFTRKKDSVKVRKQKRKAQKKARKVNLQKGFKGQKISHTLNGSRGR